MNYAQYSKTQLNEESAALSAALDAYKSRKIKLDMSRGKPGADQLDLSCDMLYDKEMLGDCLAEDGFDCRNYGLLDGISESRRLFAEILEVPEKNVIAAGNSSLNLMYDEVMRAMMFGAVGGTCPWSALPKVKFLCPVPGYDRHFTICEAFGIEMIPVQMTEQGPDMDEVARLVSSDDSIRGIWCVPKYSNPEGVVYSDETVRAFAALKPAAPDFRIFWDNAYIVHPVYGEAAVQLNLFSEAAKHGNENMPLIFTSTSKITFPGAGVAAFAASDANITHTKKLMSAQTIGYDKLNQLRHARYFKNTADIAAHMQKHAAIVRPKFDAVFAEFEKLSPYGIADWSRPQGGYFISLNVMDGCAKRVYNLAKEAGVTLTPAGATFPYGADPRDRNIRIAPTYPSAADLKTAAEILCICVRLASVEALLAVYGTAK